MRKLFNIAILGLTFFSLAGAANADVYIINPKPKPARAAIKVKKKPVPYLLKQKVSLIGSMTPELALNLIMRSVHGISLITTELKGQQTFNFYIKRKSLYRALNIVLTENGYGYSFKKGLLSVYAYETRTFKLPISDLSLKFSSTVGASGMNTNQNNMNNNTQQYQTAGTAGTTAAGTTAGTNTANMSNPGGIISLSSNSTESLLSYIKENLKVILKAGSFTIEPKNGLIYLSGPVGEVNASLKFLKRIRKNLKRMVLLKVEVLNVTLNKAFQAGINWNEVFNSAFKSNALGIGSVAIGLPLAANNNISNAPEITFGSGGNSAVINALSSQGTVNVLSQPRLMLISGETRVISSGVIQNYVQSVQTLAVGSLSSTTETYPIIGQVFSGIGIAFTPSINAKKKTVRVTINFIDNNVNQYQNFSVGGNTFSEPEVSAQSLTDTVVIPDKKTMVIGGILSTDKQKNIYGVPVLENIPLLGNLFKSVNYSKTKNDLIIMITPIITGGK
ncbi:MAG: hypothetical protein M0Z57_07100 [Deltaproteobacteria bacterium]|jgi:MSHA biogenesis protein MshL|nr:hypothetical protein [Deltaproteobacteria bacterium]